MQLRLRFLLGVVLALAAFAPRAEALLHNASGIDAEGMGGDFTLQGPGGEAVSLSDFRGKVVLLYFGYTHCPDVCPMSLSTLKGVMAALGDAAGRVQGLFVTVDPERDHGARLQEYVTYFHPSFIGLLGEPEAIYRAGRQYGVLFARQESDSAAGYLMAHTDYIYLLDQSGALRALYNSSSSEEEVMQGVLVLLRGG